jgi:hypothetical protein
MPHAYCPTHQTHVDLDQTEGQCRDRHNCNDEACPLEKELGQPRFAKALDMMAASIGQVVGKMGN